MRRALPDGFLARLEGIVGAKHTHTDEEMLARCGRDETPNLAPALPDVVVRAGSTDEVTAVIAANHALADKLAILTRAARLLSSSTEFTAVLGQVISACLPSLGDAGFFDLRVDGAE